jgi:hypothetical protein
MVMEKQSLITKLMVADATYESQVVTERYLPDSVSLRAYFETCPFVPEKAEIIEKHENTDHGHLINYTIKVNVDRDDPFHLSFYRRPLLLYIETLNGERYYLGHSGNPCRMEYSRKSGPAITDNNENELTFAHILPQ